MVDGSTVCWLVGDGVRFVLCACVYEDEVVMYLRKRVSFGLKATLAERTNVQYSSSANQFLLFGLWVCGSGDFLPASDDLLCLWLVWQARTVDPRNLSGYLSAVRNWHLSRGLPWVEVRDRYKVGWLLRGLRRVFSSPLKRKLPITPELLVRMRLCDGIAWEDPRMVVVWAAMLVAFFTMSRKDNVSVEKVDAFNARSHLTRADVRLLPGVVRCEFRRSKVIQFGSRVHVAVVLAAPGRTLDTWSAVQAAFALSPRARATDPAFLLPSGRGFVPLTHYVFVSSLKHCLRRIGVDPGLYSGHSFRRGGATFAHRLGVDPMLIKRMGDWSSDAYMGYINPHTPEGLVSLPAAMTRACARLG